MMRINLVNPLGGAMRPIQPAEKGETMKKKMYRVFVFLLLSIIAICALVDTVVTVTPTCDLARIEESVYCACHDNSHGGITCACGEPGAGKVKIERTVTE